MNSFKVNELPNILWINSLSLQLFLKEPNASLHSYLQASASLHRAWSTHTPTASRGRTRDPKTEIHFKFEEIELCQQEEWQPFACSSERSVCCWIYPIEDHLKGSLPVGFPESMFPSTAPMNLYSIYSCFLRLSYHAMNCQQPCDDHYLPFDDNHWPSQLTSSITVNLQHYWPSYWPSPLVILEHNLPWSSNSMNYHYAPPFHNIIDLYEPSLLSILNKY